MKKELKKKTKERKSKNDEKMRKITQENRNENSKLVRKKNRKKWEKKIKLEVKNIKRENFCRKLENLPDSAHI